MSKIISQNNRSWLTHASGNRRYLDAPAMSPVSSDHMRGGKKDDGDGGDDDGDEEAEVDWW